MTILNRTIKEVEDDVWLIQNGDKETLYFSIHEPTFREYFLIMEVLEHPTTTYGGRSITYHHNFKYNGNSDNTIAEISFKNGKTVFMFMSSSNIQNFDKLLEWFEELSDVYIGISTRPPLPTSAVVVFYKNILGISRMRKIFQRFHPPSNCNNAFRWDMGSTNWRKERIVHWKNSA